MAEEKTMRMSLAAKQVNVGISTIVEHLAAKGFKVEANPNFKLTTEHLDVLVRDFHTPQLLAVGQETKKEDLAVAKKQDDDLPLYFRENLTKATPDQQPVIEPEKVPLPEASVEYKKEIIEQVVIEAKLPGFKIVGKIDLNTPPKPVAKEMPQVEKSKIAGTPKLIELEEVKPAVQQNVTMPEPPAVVEQSIAEPALVVLPEVKDTILVEKVAVQEIEKPKEAKEIVAEEKAITKTPAKPVAAEEESPQAIIVEVKPTTQPVVIAPVVVIEEPAEPELIEAKADQLKGLTVLGRIELPADKSKKKETNEDRKQKRKRIRKDQQPINTNNTGTGGGNPNNRSGNNAGGGSNNNRNNNTNAVGNNNRNGNASTATPNTTTGTAGAKPANKPAANATNNNNSGNNNNNSGGKGKKDNKRNTRKDAVSDADVKNSIKSTYAKIGNTKIQSGAKYRQQKRKDRADAEELLQQQGEEQSKILKVAEFISAADLASLMDVSVNEVIATCMSMGMFVSINQRLDAEAISIIADEFDFEIQFVSAEEEIEAGLEEIIDTEEDLLFRAPIVTIMGHVDHGKTSLLDYIRKARVASGEAGGITQHIGAYDVFTETGKPITFLDTPGHEAFTAMRARGAKVTDVVIIVIAADDAIMPQTIEAINHAQNAGVPIVFAFSKVDKAGANSEKIREQLANMNILVEEWGGKFQTQEISSKSGLGISELLEKVLLEAELLDLKANPNRKAVGAVIEASLDKGRGYVSTILIQTGTMRVGDIMLAGAHHGRVKAMFDHRGAKIKEAGPATPVQVLGLSGAPQSGDKVNVMATEREAREIANKREQILREQSMRTRKHITLEEIGRRKAIGNFKELNVIVKGDVDGSVEALSDSLLKLSTEEVQVRIIHKAVGQVSESDVLLASAADAVVVAFQVRPSANAKKIAEQEQIEIRTYSIIYQAIEEIKLAMEGLLAPEFEENVTGTIEVREVFKISKIGTIAGSYVTNGFVKRNNKIRIIRDFIVIHEGEIVALKRFKDDVQEVKYGYECGVSIKNFNDIEIGDIIESYEIKEVKRKLS